VPGAASYTHLFEGCESTTVWRALTWDATLAERSVVSFAVRAADSLADLAIAPRIEVGLAPPDPSPISFDASGRFLEVEAVLHGELGDPPLLYSFGVQWQCGP